MNGSTICGGNWPGTLRITMEAIKGLRWLLLHRHDNLERDAARRLKRSLALNEPLHVLTCSRRHSQNDCHLDRPKSIVIFNEANSGSGSTCCELGIDLLPPIATYTVSHEQRRAGSL